MLGHQNLSSQMCGKNTFSGLSCSQAGGREKTELYHVSTSESLQGAIQ